jgi:serine/threonine protein phosphatase PrpC
MPGSWWWPTGLVECAGGQASGLAVQALKEAVDKAADQGLGLREAILNGIESANERISAMGIGAATTMAVVEIDGCTVRPYHVGDSMIMVIGQKGKIKLQTLSHSPVSYAVEAGLLDQTEAMNHEERHLVSNIIGSADMRIEVGPTLNLAMRDTLLLASDGLFDNLHPDEIVEGIRKGPLEKIVHDLSERCLKRMKGTDREGPSKPDDLTLILFRRNLRPRSRKMKGQRLKTED